MAGFTRILKNFGALFTGRLLSVVQQFVVPPIFVARYSLAQFGEWGMLSGAVAAIGMLNFGVQTYINQDLAIRYNRSDSADYKVHQSTGLRLLLGVVLAAAALSLVLFLLPLNTWLRLDIGYRATQWTAYLLACQVLSNILFGYFSGIFMSVSLAHRGANWSNIQVLLASLSLLVSVLLHLPFPVLAATQLASMLISIAGVMIDLRRTAPDLFPTLHGWDPSAVATILKPSGYFGVIEMSTFLTYQAPLIILQRFLGPIAVASFILMARLFSVSRQILGIFTLSMGAEITTLSGRRDWPALSTLYDYSERFIFFLVPLVNTGVLMLAPVLITVWMHKKAELFSPYPYVLMAAISMVISVKEHKFIFQFSTNTHEELAKIMFGSYVVMVLASLALVPWLGLVGFLWTWFVAETFQMIFIVRLNVRLFAHIDKIELIYLRRLVGICIPSLLLALFLLHRTAGFHIPLQIAIAVGCGALIAALDWQLFAVKGVFHKMTSQFTRKSAEPAV
jgi:O-antigen/teichoic acid export membrane protein